MKLSQIVVFENEHIDYSGIEPDAIEKLSKFPTHYQQWGVAEIKKGENVHSVIDALGYYNRQIKDNRFIDILKSITPSPKNILTLTLDQIKTAQAHYDSKYGGASKRELKRLRKEKYTTTLVDEPNLKIIKIVKSDNTDGAAKILSDLARGTKWCVTDVPTAEDYLNDGEVYLIHRNVNFLVMDEDDKDYGKTKQTDKMLCHPYSLQLMDPVDTSVGLEISDVEAIKKFIHDITLFYQDQDSALYFEAAMRNAKAAIKYAKKHGRRVIEAEPLIIKDPSLAIDYAESILRGRWPEAEPNIAKNAQTAYKYFLKVINMGKKEFQRWPEAEEKLKDSYYGVLYATDLKMRWQSAEDYIINSLIKHETITLENRAQINADSLAEKCVSYVKNTGMGRWPELEKLLISDYPSAATDYARDVIGGRWPEAEPSIMKNAFYAWIYAKAVVRGRWEEAEQVIATNGRAAYFYATEVLHARFIKGERAIYNDLSVADRYEEFVSALTTA